MTSAPPCRVLLVDDEIEYLQTLTKRLRRRKLDAHAVHSGEAALGYLDSTGADVVVLDVNMPGMGGLETLQAIKARHPHVEVIMLTGHASVDTAIEGMGHGAFDYLVKPVDLDEFLYRIQDARARQSFHPAKGSTSGRSTT